MAKGHDVGVDNCKAAASTANGRNRSVGVVEKHHLEKERNSWVGLGNQYEN